MTRSGNEEEGQVTYLLFVIRLVRMRVNAVSQIIPYVCYALILTDLFQCNWCFLSLSSIIFRFPNGNFVDGQNNSKYHDCAS